MNQLETQNAHLISEDVNVWFGERHVLRDVSLTFPVNQVTALIGPSGCGKTTILRMISGFTEPTEGVIRIGGKDVRGQRPNQRPTALIFQNLALFPLMPIWENIAFGLEVRGVPKAKRRERAEELLALVDLHDSTDKMVSQLSGGQKQRVAIARAIVTKPGLILADEPTGNLDTRNAAAVFDIFARLAAEEGRAILVVTHDAELAKRANRRIHLVDGRIVSDSRAG